MRLRDIKTDVRITSVAASVLAFVLISFGQSPEMPITRLSPAAFLELPANLVQELQRRQCTIPQETFSKGRNNVIKGEFAKRGQIDWAVLCSVNGISTILVFWNGSEKSPAAVAPKEDGGYLQGIGGDQFGYSRGIEPMGTADIERYHDPDHLGIPLPPIDHHGINDQYIGKAFLVWYYYDGRWLKVAGGD
jgi:hypothetical protein